MAIEERVSSRDQHYTRDIDTITQIFTATWAEAEAKTDGTNSLPYLGTPFSPARPDLIIVDERRRALPKNDTHCEIIFTYSNGGQPYPQSIPETVASVTQDFDFTYTPSNSDTYYDWGTSKEEEWTDIYGGTKGNAPPRIPEGPQMTMVISGNVTTWDFDDVKDAIGRVNDRNFLDVYVERWLVSPEGLDIYPERIGFDVPYDDAGYWLFAGFHSELIGRDISSTSGYPNYRIQETFIYSPDWKWNAPYGITGYQAYLTTNFTSLPRPTQRNSAFETGLR